MFFSVTHDCSAKFTLSAPVIFTSGPIAHANCCAIFVNCLGWCLCARSVRGDVFGGTSIPKSSKRERSSDAWRSSSRRSSRSSSASSLDGIFFVRARACAFSLSFRARSGAKTPSLRSGGRGFDPRARLMWILLCALFFVSRSQNHLPTLFRKSE